MKVFKVVTTIKYYKIVSAQMDAGARSDTAAGIRLPRYPPGKQTKVGAEGPSRLSVLMNYPKVSCYAMRQKTLLLFVSLSKE
jgi:hypothetical protein